MRGDPSFVSSREREIDLEAVREFADGLMQLVWVTDDAGCREYFNPAWSDFTGLSLAQSVGNGWQLALHPADLDPILQRWEEHRGRGLPYGVSFRFRSADDEYRLFTGAMFPIRDASGAVRKWIGICDESGAQARADIAAWGPAEDWSDWADAAR